MSVPLRGVRVFFASPGGLDDERRRFREFLLQLNEDDAIERGTVFIPVRWEETLQGVGRPQQKINDDLRTSDYFVLVLWDRWGSPPDDDGEYTSGTEEEYKLASALLADESAPMKDIIVLFKGVEDRQLSDPGTQLQQVLDFKKSLEESKSLLYGTFDSLDEFERHLLKHLLAWLRSDDSKDARSAPEVLPEGEVDTSWAGEGKDLLELAEQYAREERDADAERIFARIVTARPSIESLRKYARFLRRKGRTTHSRAVTEHLLRLSNEQNSDAGRIFALTNLGLLERKLGKLEDSERYFREAIVLAEGSVELSREVKLAYILDNLGHTLRRMGKSEEAIEAHESALAFRELTGDTNHLGYTYNNLGALHRRYGRYKEARTRIDRALELFEEVNDEAGLASALSNLGLVHETVGDFEKAQEAFEQSYELNRARGSSDGLSMNLSQLSRMAVHNNDLESARAYAEECLRINRRGGNQEGIGTGLQHVGRVALAEGHLDEAMKSFDLSLEVFRSIPHRLGVAGVLADKARALSQSGDTEGAVALARESSAIARELDEMPLLEESEHLMRQLDT
jgi:tetratricopeptide (TPR) repeat protein